MVINCGIEIVKTPKSTLTVNGIDIANKSSNFMGDKQTQNALTKKNKRVSR